MTVRSSEPINETLAKRTLAALGVSPDIGSESMSAASWSDLHARRGSLRRALKEIAAAGAGEGRAEMNDAEYAAACFAGSIIGNISTELDRREASGQREPITSGMRVADALSGGGFSRQHGGDASSSFLTVPRSGNVSDIVRGQGDGRARQPGLGELLRASITGDWTGLQEFRSQSMNDGPTGGFLVGEYLSARIIDLARNQARVVQAGATTIPIIGATTFAAVEQDVTTTWRGENEQIPESNMIFSGRTFRPNTLAALVRCSIELVEDAPNLANLVESSISAQLALGLDRMCLVGDGVGKPLGLLNTTGVNLLNTTSAGPVDYGPLTNYSLLSQAVEAVRANNVEPGDFIMAPRTAGEIDRLVDTLGQPLQPPKSVAERQFLTTNQIDTNMSPAGHDDVTNATVAATGLWEDLYLAIRTNITIEATRVADDAFKNMQVLIRGYLRADAFPVRPNHFAVISGITPPA